MPADLSSLSFKITPKCPIQFCNPRPENPAKVWYILKNGVITLFLQYSPNTISVFAKISIFDQNFDFDQISIFLPKLRFLAKISIFGQISIFCQNFDFWPKFRFFFQNFDFWPKFRFLTKFRFLKKTLKFNFRHFSDNLVYYMYFVSEFNLFLFITCISFNKFLKFFEN